MSNYSYYMLRIPFLSSEKTAIQIEIQFWSNFLAESLPFDNKGNLNGHEFCYRNPAFSLTKMFEFDLRIFI